MARFERRFRARSVAVRLSLVAAALIVLHVIVMLVYYSSLKKKIDLHYWQISVFDLDKEEGFGTWFSTMMLMFASGLLFMQARARKAAGDAMQRWWWFLGLGFGFLSLDEVVGVHEWVNSTWDEIPWTQFGAVVAALVGALYIPLLIKLPTRTRVLFIIAGAIYLGGALGVERATDVYLERDEINTLPYNLWNTLEEGLEMFGVILFIYALIAHMAGSARTALWQTTELTK